jgi:cobalt-zinc-cadmium efflux system protein
MEKHAASVDRRRLYIVLAVTASYCALELAGGWYTNSLALLTDAVHVFTDIAAIFLSLLTLWISGRPASADKTYGYLRAEILGALLNGLLLWLIVIAIWIEAWHRLFSPAPVRGLEVAAIAVVGMGVNGFSAWMTSARGHGAHHRGMAVRAIFVHVVSDLIGSLGVLASGLIIYFTGWRQADAIAGFIIGLLVVYSSWQLVREGVDILMESVPSHIDLDELRSDLLAVAGTEEVHDLHVWCLTSRQFALSAHAVVGHDIDQDKVLSEMSRVLESKFDIRHMTVQLECDSRREHEPDHF